MYWAFIDSFFFLPITCFCPVKPWFDSTGKGRISKTFEAYKWEKSQGCICRSNLLHNILFFCGSF